MSESLNPEQQLQSILKNISVGGNLTTGDISQILNLFVIVQQPNTFIPKSTPYNIPSSNTIKFVGRADALEQVHQALQQNSQVAITAIEGMGGVGKTELATQYCLLHLLLNTYPGGICWLRARDEDIGIQILRFAETKLGIKPPEDWDIEDRVDFCWSRWQEKKDGDVLIVLDDVNDYPKTQPYLPPQLSQFKILITTRLQLDLPQSFSLDILSESASLELLRQWISEEKINDELAEAKELCLRLDYLPLALNLVGRYVQKRKISLAEVLRRLEKKGLRHPALDIDKKDRTRTLNIKRGVAAAFELSWEELSEDAQKLGCLLSLFALASIPWSLVQQVEISLDNEELEDARIELEDLHLIQKQDDYQLHSLIREFFRIKFEKLQNGDSIKKKFTKQILQSVDSVPLVGSQAYIQEISKIVPHLIEIASNFIDFIDNKQWLNVLKSINSFYKSQGFYEQAITWNEQFLKLTKQRFGLDSYYCIVGTNDLALLYKDIESNNKALDLFIEAYKLAQKILKPSHIDNAAILNSLADLYRCMYLYEEAEDCCQKAIPIVSENIKQDGQTTIISPLLFMIPNNLGLIYSDQGRNEEAEEHFNISLNIIVQTIGIESSYYAQGLNNIAAVHESQGRFKLAEKIYKKALKIHSKVLDNKHIDVIANLICLMNFYLKQSNYKKAEIYIEKILKAQLEVGRQQPKYLTNLDKIAHKYKANNLYEEALFIYERNLKTRKILSESHDIAANLINIADTYVEQGIYEKAKLVIQEAEKSIEELELSNNFYDLGYIEILKNYIDGVIKKLGYK